MEGIAHHLAIRVQSGPPGFCCLLSLNGWLSHMPGSQGDTDLRRLSQMKPHQDCGLHGHHQVGHRGCVGFWQETDDLMGFMNSHCVFQYLCSKFSMCWKSMQGP